MPGMFPLTLAVLNGDYNGWGGGGGGGGGAGVLKSLLRTVS